jgi:hypothetical protein
MASSTNCVDAFVRTHPTNRQLAALPLVPRYLMPSRSDGAVAEALRLDGKGLAEELLT